MPKLMPCPDCLEDDILFINISSSRELKLSQVDCSICGFTFQKNVSEENIIKFWNRIQRQEEIKMECYIYEGGIDLIEN